jgi:hypothetical protein
VALAAETYEYGIVDSRHFAGAGVAGPIASQATATPGRRPQSRNRRRQAPLWFLRRGFV